MSGAVVVALIQTTISHELGEMRFSIWFVPKIVNVSDFEPAMNTEYKPCVAEKVGVCAERVKVVRGHSFG